MRPSEARISLVNAIGGAAGPAVVAPSAHQAWSSMFESDFSIDKSTCSYLVLWNA
jgi:hypothetical protein